MNDDREVTIRIIGGTPPDFAATAAHVGEMFRPLVEQSAAIVAALRPTAAFAVRMADALQPFVQQWAGFSQRMAAAIAAMPRVIDVEETDVCDDE